MPTAVSWNSIRLVLGCTVVVAACLGIFTSSALAAPGEGCPNEALRQAQTSETLPEGSVFLPDCMALEMASPSEKFNQTAATANFSANGNRVQFASVAALAGTPGQSGLNDNYVATRTPSGWETQYTAPPSSIFAGPIGSGQPCSYTPDLSRWVTWGSTQGPATVGITTAYEAALGGLYLPISPSLVPFSGGSGEPNAISNGLCEGADAAASQIFFKIADIAYLPGDPRSLGGYGNVYEARLDAGGVPSVELLARDGDGVVHGGTCGSHVGGVDQSLPKYGMNRGAIAANGSRVYFSARPTQAEGLPCNTTDNKTRILERLEAPGGPQISELIASECTRVAPPCDTADGDDNYIGASQEGSRVYFETTRQLANSDLDTSSDLYLYEATAPLGERLTQVTAGDGSDPEQGKNSGFLGVPDFSGDGSHVYIVAKGELTATANAAGETAEAGQPNLYLYERDSAHPEGRTVFIATLSAADSQTWLAQPGETNKATAVPRLGTDFEDQADGGDGHVLVFLTTQPLSADDTDGGAVDVYRYDSDTGVLQRVSRATPGGADGGPFAAEVQGGSLNPGPQNLYFGRWVSEDGQTIAFTTKEALDPADANGERDAYLWHEGELTAVPTAIGAYVSMSGEEVGFQSNARLLPQDGDNALDVYVARTDGGFAPSVPPVPCEGEGCQGPPSAQPAISTGASASFVGAGNAKARKSKPHKKHKKHRRHKKQTSHKRGGQK